MCTRKFAAAAMAVGGLLWAGSAPATLVLEFDFRNLSGTNVNASVAAPTASGTADLSGTAVVNTGVNAGMPSGILNQGILYGSMAVPLNQTSYLITSGTDNKWSDYTSTNGFGTGTAAMIFKPAATGRPPYRCYLWTARLDGQWNNTIIGAQRGAEGTKDLEGWTQYYQSGWHVDSVTTTDQSWDSNTWYFIATSWAEGQPVTSYIRALGSSERNYEVGTNGVVASPYWLDGPVVVGGFQGAAGASQGAWGSFALFQLRGNEYYADESAFDALYSNLMVPEPAAGLLWLLGAGALGIARRLRR